METTTITNHTEFAQWAIENYPSLSTLGAIARQAPILLAAEL